MFWESDQCLFSFIQKETDWQVKFFVKMAGTLFLSTIDPLLIQLLRPFGEEEERKKTSRVVRCVEKRSFLTSYQLNKNHWSEMSVVEIN